MGVIADLRGNEDHLISAEPVVERDGQLFIAHGSDWEFDDLVPLGPGEQDYVTFLRPRDHGPIEQRQVVWLAGRNFVADVQSNMALLDVRREFQSTKWRNLRLGYRWSIGSMLEIQELRQRISNHLEPSLHRQLFDSMELSHGDAAGIQRLYAEVADPTDGRRYLNLGLYFHAIRDQFGLELVCARAVANAEFNDEKEYWSALDELRASLSSTRLHERATPAVRRMSNEQFGHWFKLATTTGLFTSMEKRTLSSMTSAEALLHEIEKGINVDR